MITGQTNEIAHMIEQLREARKQKDLYYTQIEQLQ